MPPATDHVADFQALLAAQTNTIPAQVGSGDSKTPSPLTNHDRASSPQAAPPSEDEAVRDAFQSFVGQTLFGMMIKEMRKSVNKTAYFHGGMAEEVFEQQLDTVIAEKLAAASGDRFATPMYELFQLRQTSR